MFKLKIPLLTLLLMTLMFPVCAVAADKGGAAVESRSEKWKEDYPDQYNSWFKTRSNDKIDDMLAEYPQLAVLWAGYGFAKDYNAPRGHAYALQSNINTLRTGAPVDQKTGPMPTACWTCKSPDVPRMIQEDGEMEYFTGKWAKYGDEMANAIGCADCHNQETMELTLTRPFVARGLEAAGIKKKDITQNEMRSLVCAQCHSEYYFKKTEWTDDKGTKKTAAVVTFPWENGFTAEEMERLYDSYEFKDWTHKISKAPMLKAQHPGYEIAKTGVHYQRGVSCADCHMPATKDGYTDHHIVSPLENIKASCLQCHDETESQLKATIKAKKQRKEHMMVLAMDSLAKAHLEAGKAWELGATEAEMKEILGMIRSAQWRWDYSIASHGSFFHAPGETLRLLGDSLGKAQDARIALV